jgi:anhydro-N-acetylmuramic acid kinase
MIVIGLISGTSADGTDVAVVEIEGAPPQLQWRLLHAQTVPHPKELRAAVLRAINPQTSPVDLLCSLNVQLAEQFAAAALAGMAAVGLRPEDVHLIGSHGQTVWHAPDLGATLQLGEAAVLAERTGIPVISNFRARDMAAGGQGAPLVAYVDVLLLTHPDRVRAAQNIGGIGNVTFLPPANQPDVTAFAFDTGPGNVLIDLTTALATDGRQQYDADGALAAQGMVDQALLEWLLAEPYLATRPPKTTGRELFTADLAQQIWQRGLAAGLGGSDIAATVTMFTAQSIAQAYRDFLPLPPIEVVVSGGGGLNHTLLKWLTEAVAPARVLLSDELGLSSEAKEAVAFAILAYESWHGRPGNLPAATGARRPVVLGDLTGGRLGD